MCVLKLYLERKINLINATFCPIAEIYFIANIAFFLCSTNNFPEIIVQL